MKPETGHADRLESQRAMKTDPRVTHGSKPSLETDEIFSFGHIIKKILNMETRCRVCRRVYRGKNRKSSLARHLKRGCPDRLAPEENSDRPVNVQEHREISGGIAEQFPSQKNVSESILGPSVREESEADFFVRQVEEDQVAELARFTLQSVSFMELPRFLELASHRFPYVRDTIVVGMYRGLSPRETDAERTMRVTCLPPARPPAVSRPNQVPAPAPVPVPVVIHGGNVNTADDVILMGFEI